MSDQTLIAEYLVKAKQAQVLADGFPDTASFFKASWLGIAKGYRDLAEAEQSSAPSSEGTSPAS